MLSTPHTSLPHRRLGPANAGLDRHPRACSGEPIDRIKIMPNQQPFGYAFAAGLVAFGLWILLSGGVELPTRRPPVAFHFSGLSLLLLGASPITLGTTLLAVVRGRLPLNGRSTQLLIGLALALLGIAFAIVPKH